MTDFNELEKYFDAVDFAVFFALLILSASIGIYFGCKDKNRKSVETYFFGDRNVSPFAVAMSMAVSFVSAITVIGFPVETYFHGIVFLWIIISSVLTAIIAAVYFIPLIFRLQLKSMFEYFELRYSRRVRKLCSVIYMIKMVSYMGITIYLPALALNSVTPLDIKWSIALTSLICTFYTALGGIKAVIWTDVLQGFIMLFGALTLFVKATLDVGGITIVAQSVEEGGRLNFFNFHPDIRVSSTAGAYFSAYFVLSMEGSCFSQVYAQRYLSCKTVSAAKRATLIRLIPESIFVLLAAADGMALYAYYKGCDPYEAGYITKKDQLTPRFAVEVFRTIPGLAGLFVAAAYSGTLSTVSSGINALAAIATEDFVYPCRPSMSATRVSLVAKLLTVIFGILVTGVSYLISGMASTVVEIAFALGGIFTAPVVTVYIMGVVCPWINEKGALAGIIIASAFNALCSIGRIFHSVAAEFTQTLPLDTVNCTVIGYVTSNFTTITSGYGISNLTTVTSDSESLAYRSPLADNLFAISPYFYGVIGCFVATISMIFVSGITGFRNPKESKPDLFVPLVGNQKIFSRRIVTFFRFGVPEMEERHELMTLRDESKDFSTNT